MSENLQRIINSNVVNTTRKVILPRCSQSASSIVDDEIMKPLAITALSSVHKFLGIAMMVPNNTVVSSVVHSRKLVNNVLGTCTTVPLAATNFAFDILANRELVGVLGELHRYINSLIPCEPSADLSSIHPEYYMPGDKPEPLSEAAEAAAASTAALIARSEIESHHIEQAPKNAEDEVNNNKSRGPGLGALHQRAQRSAPAGFSRSSGRSAFFPPPPSAQSTSRGAAYQLNKDI